MATAIGKPLRLITTSANIAVAALAGKLGIALKLLVKLKKSKSPIPGGGVIPS